MVASDCFVKMLDVPRDVSSDEHRVLLVDDDASVRWLIRAVRAVDLDLPVIILTGHPDVPSASAAVELRAFRYFTKPPDLEAFGAAVHQAVATYRLVSLERQAAEANDGPSRDVERRFLAGIDGLYMAYQPLVATDIWRVFGYEALMRTREPSIPHPGEFLDLARRLGAHHELGRATRLRAAVEAALAPEQGVLFLNVSPVDLADAELFDRETPLGAIAGRVVLELTERESLAGVPDAADRRRELRRLGFRIAIDDLGAGYAALSYFASVEPDLVKLDMSLVRDIDASVVKQRTVLSLVQLAHSLGIEVVAEGIETRAECDVLVRLGCDLVQGYLFARPAPGFPSLDWSPGLVSG